MSADLYNRQLHQSEYDLAKKYAKLVAQQLGISVEDAEGRIVAELQRNLDGQTAQAEGDVHDYQLHSILGCQVLECNASSTDPNYWNHNYNSQYIAPNQQAYDLGIGQSHTGQTYNQLVTSNVKNDPVGATLAGAGMIGLGVITAGGVPTLTGMATGGVLGGAANATMQYVFGGSVNPKDVAMGTATGALTFGTSLMPSLLMNTGGALALSGIKGENPNGNLMGAGLGTAFGFGVGTVTEGTLNGVLNPWYRQEWRDLGLGVSTFVPKSPLPSIFGTGASAFGQETIGNTTNLFLNWYSSGPKK